MTVIAIAMQSPASADYKNSILDHVVNNQGYPSIDYDLEVEGVREKAGKEGYKGILICSKETNLPGLAMKFPESKIVFYSDGQTAETGGAENNVLCLYETVPLEQGKEIVGSFLQKKV